MSRATLDAGQERTRNINYRYFTSNQLENRLREVVDNRRAVQLREFNLLKRTARLNRTLDLNKRVMILLATEEIGGARRLLSQALRDGKSAHALLGTLELALEGKYNARGYTDRDFSIAILALRLGGQALLFALHQCAGFPGITAVYNKMKDRSVGELLWLAGRVEEAFASLCNPLVVSTHC